MSGESRAFVDELREAIESRRSFGRHPLWLRICDGELPRSGLGIFSVQFFLQVLEFPRAVSALHASCPLPEQRALLAESLYEEETGRISGCGVSHPELFLRFGEAVGVPREQMRAGRPLPETAALINWFELATKQRSFLEGAAAINLAAEGQVPGAFGPFARALQRHYELSTEQVAFWDVHEQADREHSDVGDHIVVRSVGSAAERDRVRAAMGHSLDLWWQFFDGMQRAIDG